MSLLEDVKSWYNSGTSYPPEASDLSEDTEKVQDHVIDDTPRWGDVVEMVYKRGDEYVAVHDIAPATEMQDWGDYGDPEIFEAIPVAVTVTEYRKKV